MKGKKIRMCFIVQKQDQNIIPNVFVNCTDKVSGVEQAIYGHSTKVYSTVNSVNYALPQYK